MSDDLVKLQVSDDLIKNIVSRQVTAAMLTALGGKEQFLEGIVEAALTYKVDGSGKRSSYSSDNKITWLDFMIQKMIQEAATEALKSWIQQNKATLQKSVEKTLRQKGNVIGNAVVDGLVDAMKYTWSFKVEARV